MKCKCCEAEYKRGLKEGKERTIARLRLFQKLKGKTIETDNKTK